MAIPRFPLRHKINWLALIGLLFFLVSTPQNVKADEPKQDSNPTPALQQQCPASVEPASLNVFKMRAASAFEMGRDGASARCRLKCRRPGGCKINCQRQAGLATLGEFLRDFLNSSKLDATCLVYGGGLAYLRGCLELCQGMRARTDLCIEACGQTSSARALLSQESKDQKRFMH